MTSPQRPSFLLLWASLSSSSSSSAAASVPAAACTRCAESQDVSPHILTHVILMMTKALQVGREWFTSVTKKKEILCWTCVTRGSRAQHTLSHIATLKWSCMQATRRLDVLSVCVQEVNLWGLKEQLANVWIGRCTRFIPNLETLQLQQ